MGILESAMNFPMANCCDLHVLGEGNNLCGHGKVADRKRGHI